jgi:hypothetical protein
MRAALWKTLLTKFYVVFISGRRILHTSNIVQLYGRARADPSQTFVSVYVSPKLFNPLGASNAPDNKLWEISQTQSGRANWVKSHKRFFCLFCCLALVRTISNIASSQEKYLKRRRVRGCGCCRCYRNTYWGSKMFWGVLYCSPTIRACCPVARMQRGDEKGASARPTLCNLGALEGPPLFPLIPHQITC